MVMKKIDFETNKNLFLIRIPNEQDMVLIYQKGCQGTHNLEVSETWIVQFGEYFQRKFGGGNV